MELRQQLLPRLLQKQILVLTPAVLERLKVLQNSYGELVDKILTEAKENDALHITRDDQLINYYSKGRRLYRPLATESTDVIARVADRASSMQAHLVDQLYLEDLDELDQKIGEEIISEIDERGYLNNYTELKARLMQDYSVSRIHPDKLLQLIQTFEPEGVGARTLKECLLIQIREYALDDEEQRAMFALAVREGLNFIAQKKLDKLQELLEVETETAQIVISFIEHNLNPNPGSRFVSAEELTYITPTFKVEKEENRYKIRNLEENRGIQIQISSKHIDMLEDPNLDPQTREYVEKKVLKAKEMVNNLKNRERTLDTIARILEDVQQIFFGQGKHWLMPLQQNEIARQINVHPSTISRAVADKFIETAEGIYPIKYLMPRNFKGFSVPAIKRIMADVLKSGYVGSDAELMVKLKEFGIEIKRRTVNKYRNELIHKGEIVDTTPRVFGQVKRNSYK